MGWDFWAASKGELVAELTADTPGRKCLGSAEVPENGEKVLWVGWEAEPSGDFPGGRFVVAYLIGTTRAHGRAFWGSKDIDEGMGPYYYSCPAGLLERTEPGPQGWGPGTRAWREAMIGGGSRAERQARHLERAEAARGVRA